MRSFKSFITERSPAWTESLSTMLFDLPRAGLKDVKIPLSPAIFKRIWPETIRSTVFHVTDYDGVKNLKRMQGGKKSISAFYNLDSDRIDYGIQTEGGYIVEVEADVLVAGAEDIASQPDKTGRRWLTLSMILGEMGGASKLKGMERDIEKMLKGIVKEYSEEDDILKLVKTDVATAWVKFGQYKISGFWKSQIIKDYIDGIEVIMKKYSKKLRSVFTDYTKKRTLRGGDNLTAIQQLSMPEWDELIVNNFTIKMVHVGETYADDFEGDDAIDMYGLPFKTWDQNSELTTYIKNKVRKGK